MDHHQEAMDHHMVVMDHQLEVMELIQTGITVDWQPQLIELVQHLIRCKLIYDLRLEGGISDRKNQTTMIYHQ